MLEAAVHVFAARGFADTQTTAARTAGISHACLFGLFPTKSELAVAVAASGATNAIREIGGVLGISVLSSVFAAHGSLASPTAFVDGLRAAAPVGVAVLVAIRSPRIALRRRSRSR